MIRNTLELDSTSPARTVFCAIQHIDLEPWKSIRRFGAERTWLMKPTPPNIHIVFFTGRPLSSWFRIVEKLHEKLRWSSFGKFMFVLDYMLLKPLMSRIPNSELIRLDGNFDELVVEFPDAFFSLNAKFLGLYKYFLEETDSSFLYTTTTGSYIRPDKLVELCQELPLENVYAGSVLTAGKRRFVSGANRLMSRDVVERLVENRRLWNPAYLEDLSQGVVAEQIGIPFTPLKTINIHSLDEFRTKQISGDMTNFHFRVKCGANRYEADVEIMMELHRVFGSD